MGSEPLRPGIWTPFDVQRAEALLPHVQELALLECRRPTRCKKRAEVDRCGPCRRRAELMGEFNHEFTATELEAHLRALIERASSTISLADLRAAAGRAGAAQHPLKAYLWCAVRHLRAIYGWRVRTKAVAELLGVNIATVEAILSKDAETGAWKVDIHMPSLAIPLDVSQGSNRKAKRALGVSSAGKINGKPIAIPTPDSVLRALAEHVIRPDVTGRLGVATAETAIVIVGDYDFDALVFADDHTNLGSRQ